VTDQNNSSNTLEKIISVYRTKNNIIPVLPETLSAKIELQTKVTVSKRLTNSGIVCAVSSSGTCSLNFTGE
jgi:hypothetical protein